MSIEIQDLENEMRSLLDEKDPEFWESSDLRNHMNQGLRFAFKFWYRSTEFVFLEEESIVVDTTAVTNKTKTFPLPSLTMYVSRYCKRHPYWDNRFDKRPRFDNGSGSNDTGYLDSPEHYVLDGLNIIFRDAFTETGNIIINVKKLPPRITDQTTSLDMLPDFLFDSLLEASLIFARRKDENPEEVKLLTESLSQDSEVLRTMTGIPGFVGTGFTSLADSGDL